MYSIRLAAKNEMDLLPTIERAAAAQFRDSPYPHLADAPLAADSIEPDDDVWVVVEVRHIVGFAIARKSGDAIHIQEVDVHPEHARRGLGRQLIEHIAQWARELGFRAVTLTTFSDVPWNGPYYSRLGFTLVPADSMTSELRAILKAEEAAGIPMEHRICMRRPLTL
jgi:GNAT superfamily N-acetyltransferase